MQEDAEWNNGGGIDANMKISFFFAWFDLWIGAYYNQQKRTWYICPLPMCVIMVELAHDIFSKCIAHRKPGWKLPKPPDIECDMCEQKASKAIAVDTGEGWALMWECKNECGCINEYLDEWPFVEDKANSYDMEAAGFEPV